MILDASVYQREFEMAETAPAPGTARISGLVSDGGTACGDPIGTSPMQAALTLGKTEEIEAAFDDPARQAEMMQRIVQQTAAMSDADFDNQADSTFALPAQIGTAWNRDAVAGLGLGFEFMGREIESIVGPHVALRLFSPNAFGWQLDWIPSGNDFIEHGGVGGWRANSGLAVGVILPGVDIHRLRVGETVVARMAANPDDSDDEASVVYSSWTGRHVPVTDGTNAFEGEVVTVRSSRLAGTFRVTEITGAEVRGELRLSGPAHRLTEHIRFTRDEDGRIDGETTEDDDEHRGPVTIEATLRLPAAVDVVRPGRFIERTSRVGSLR